MRRVPRATLVIGVAALVLWIIAMPIAFIGDGGWRIAGFAVWVPSMITFWIFLVREEFRQDRLRTRSGSGHTTTRPRSVAEHPLTANRVGRPMERET